MLAAVNQVDTSGQQAVTTSVKKILGKDDFLKLMITQLKYQDPLEPTDNKDFIAQMAQFSSLEQMMNMGNGFQSLAGMQESTLREYTISQAINMIGRTVKAVIPAAEVTGTINLESTNLYLEASNASRLLQVLAKSTAVTLLGKEGQMYQVKLADGTTGYVDEAALTVNEAPSLIGVVTGMKIVDNVPNVIVSGKVVPISLIEEVA